MDRLIIKSVQALRTQFGYRLTLCEGAGGYPEINKIIFGYYFVM